MAISYRPCEPQQEMLLPASLQDWLPHGHLARGLGVSHAGRGSLPLKLGTVAIDGTKIKANDPERHPHTAAMATQLQSEGGKTACRRRKWIAEPPNGWIRSVLGFRQFSLRGLHRVQAGFKPGSSSCAWR